MAHLTGKVAIVTGAAAGPKAALGSVFAKALAVEGVKVVVADAKDCGSVAADIAAGGSVAHPLTVDVRDQRSIAAMIAETEKMFGRLDILVNNAAIGSNIPPVAIEDITIEQWDDFMAVNVRGTFLCTRGGSAHAPQRLRQDHQSRRDHQAVRPVASPALCHQQGRHRRDDALAGARAWAVWHPGQFAVARTGDERIRGGGDGRTACTIKCSIRAPSRTTCSPPIWSAP